ncbi:DNA cytosine methyltransferase [Weissella kandleri]|uniref:DNA cytosine methyltransferase n=1 Tax=Weissella kandleri TaxID=1616 RepID=UPI00387ED0E2
MVKEFISSSTLDESEVKDILFKKIKEEQALANELENDTSIVEKVTLKPNKFNVVSLFSGAGGLDLGLELAGIDAIKGRNFTDEIYKTKKTYFNNRSESLFNIVYSNDMFKEANETYLNNFLSSVVKDAQDIRKVANFPKAQIMIGGFPCPGFSSAGPRLIDDPRNFLYIHFIRALTQHEPEFFIAENVKGLMTLAKGTVFKQVKEDFASAGYDVQAFLVNSRDYGVPQLRERVILVGSHVEKIVKPYGYTFKAPEHTHGPKLIPYVTLKDAIGDLPKNPEDVYEGGFSSMYMSRNRKKSWNDQSFTIQASGRQAPMWPGGSPMKKIDKNSWIFTGDSNLNRRISVKEAARIQTFPDWWIFSDGGNKNSTKNNRLNLQYKQIGNAVPVNLARNFLKPIADFLSEHPELSE